MFEDKKLKVIVSKWDNNEMYIIDADDVKKVNLHDCYDQDGQQLDAEASGDYSLKNCYCDSMENEMKAKGVEIFGESFSDMEYDKNDLTIDNAEEIGLKEKEKEINDFISKFEEDEAYYIECEAIQYWDGHNNRSAIIGGEEVGAEYEYEDSELEKEILNEFYTLERPEYKRGIAEVKGEKYYFRFSQFENKNFCICEVSERSLFDDEE